MTNVEKAEKLLNAIEDYIYENGVCLESSTLIYDGFFDNDEKYINFLQEYVSEKFGCEEDESDFVGYEEDDGALDRHIRRMSWVSGSRNAEFLPNDIQVDYIEYLEDYLSNLENE